MNNRFPNNSEIMIVKIKETSEPTFLKIQKYSVIITYQIIWNIYLLLIISIVVSLLHTKEK